MELLTSDGDPLISRKRIFIHISGGLDPKEIWIRIRFLEINGSQSLLLTTWYY